MLEIGYKIRKLRESKNYSQEAFAEELNISQASLCKIENGQQRTTLDLLEKICEVFKVDIQHFFGTQNIQNNKIKTIKEKSGVNTHIYNDISETLLAQIKTLIEINKTQENRIKEQAIYIEELEKKLGKDKE